MKHVFVSEGEFCQLEFFNAMCREVNEEKVSIENEKRKNDDNKDTVNKNSRNGYKKITQDDNVNNLKFGSTKQSSSKNEDTNDEVYTQKEALKEEGVVEVLEAWYGRMQIGRCVQQNYGYLGCKSDVTEVVAKKCDARSSCSFQVGGRVV